MTVGPWDESEPLGTEGREPHVALPWRYAPENLYAWDEIAYAIRYARHYGPNKGPAVKEAKSFPLNACVKILIDGGEGVQVHGIPDPWIHVAIEGVNLGWSKTPHKFAQIPCNNRQPGVTWLPPGFDVEEHYRDNRVPCYDLGQIAANRMSRKFVWAEVQRLAPDLHCLFRDGLWGWPYAEAHRNMRATFACAGMEFVTMRVMEAMAMGCIVLADRSERMRELFEPGVHYIEFESIKHKDCDERIPDPKWLVEQAWRIRDYGETLEGQSVEAMVDNACVRVHERHSWQHRARTLLEAVV
jgi:glycosyltransferase involved in cell wall biosynthesis